MIVRTFRCSDAEQVIDLWTQCDLTRPGNDPRQDIARKMAFQPDLFLVAELDGRVVGTVMVGYDGHRGWTNYLGVLPERQRSGVGRRLMEESQSRLSALGCSKINLQVRGSNTGVIAFYKRIGFLQDDVVSFGKRLIDDQAKS